ncbi:hypothetical protein [Neisseria iguanae]|uniref:Uncharacterized protein n=1 Tax=Neisseria iguanae TaxID=90242 RepID=A0A2P7U2T7_9NEIS|nr:hypothetical protein [Neisseria iguanae]PSJ81288.1 hypothetical protein C7N83_01005 [Neisseria iguanae]
MGEFLIELEKQQEAITQAAAELKTYREQILADLLHKTNEQLEESEGHLYGAIQKRIAVHTEAQINEVVKTMRYTMVATVAVCLALILIAKWIF